MEVWIVIGVLAGLFAWRILSHNRFVLQLQQIHAAWSEIDSDVRRRLDVVPELVGLVRGRSGDQTELFEQVASAREAAAFEPHLRRLVALAEDLPDLRSSEAYRRIEEELATTEDRLAGHRGVYNGRVSELNRRVRSFPSSVIARISGIGPAEYFTVAPSPRAASGALAAAPDRSSGSDLG